MDCFSICFTVEVAVAIVRVVRIKVDIDVVAGPVKSIMMSFCSIVLFHSWIESFYWIMFKNVHGYLSIHKVYARTTKLERCTFWFWNVHRTDHLI